MTFSDFLSGFEWLFVVFLVVLSGFAKRLVLFLVCLVQRAKCVPRI